MTGGALSEDGSRWIEGRSDYLFPVKVMGKLFRGKMLDGLRQAERSGELRVPEPAHFGALIAGLYRKDWVVYCKPPFAGPEQVVAYLGQYTHRVAISNHRLVCIDERGVTFRTKTGEHVTLDGVTFLSRWLRHVLPPGFVKIRHFGLMSARHATTRLEVARNLLAASADSTAPTPKPPTTGSLATAKWRDVIRVLTGIDLGACPRCGSRDLDRRPLPSPFPGARAPPDTA